MTILPPLAVVFGYLSGSIPVGYLLVKYLFTEGIDVRSIGSGNIGATNVGRAAGAPVAVITALLDIAKGYAPVLLASQWTHHDLGWMSAAGVAAMLGHMFPVWLGFRGGKGVATGVGVYLVIAPQALLASLFLWVCVVWRSRFVSLGSIVAAATLPVWLVFWEARASSGPFPQLLNEETFAILACSLVIAKHHENIRKLLAGTEPRLKALSGNSREP